MENWFEKRSLEDLNLGTEIINAIDEPAREGFDIYDMVSLGVSVIRNELDLPRREENN